MSWCARRLPHCGWDATRPTTWLGSARRTYQIGVHAHADPYVDPDTWQARTAQMEGSWWPAWEGWLARRAGQAVPPPPDLPDRPPAPGTYVLQP